MNSSFIKKLTLISSVCLAVAGPIQAMTLKLSHVRPEGSAADVDLRAFASEVEADTGNKLKFRLYPANALGDYTLVQERVGLGAVDMALQPAAATSDKRMQLLTLPYLVKDWTSAKTVFGSGSPFRQTANNLYEKQGIKILGAWPVYFGGIALNKEVPGAADPTVQKGMKLRVPPTKAFQMTADSLGYIGSPLPFSEAFTAMQTGVVDGIVGSGAEGYYASFRDVTKVYVPLNTHFEIWYLLINDEVFNDLSEKEQKSLETAAAHFEQARWKTAEQDQAHNEELLVNAGAKLEPVTEQELDDALSIVRKNVWPVIINDIGADWANKVLDESIGKH